MPTEQISVRLTKTQSSLIWEGLAILAEQGALWRIGKSLAFQYPFRIYPPPQGFDRGQVDQSLMGKVIQLEQKIRPKSRRGGRLRLDAIEIRAAIFAVRVKLGHQRYLRRLGRKWDNETKRGWRVDKTSLKKLAVASSRVVRSLERHMKRANRALRNFLGPAEYASQMTKWQKHLRWMRLNLAHFKPWPKGIRGRKRRYQETVDTLVKMAERGIRNQELEPPDKEKLRRLMRLYAASARRLRQGTYTIRFLMENPGYFNSTSHLADFVKNRINLKPPMARKRKKHKNLTAHRRALEEPGVKERLAELRRMWKSMDRIERGDVLLELASEGCSTRGLGKALRQSPTTIRRHMDLARLPEKQREAVKAHVSAKKVLALRANTKRRERLQARILEERKTGRFSDELADIILEFCRGNDSLSHPPISADELGAFLASVGMQLSEFTNRGYRPIKLAKRYGNQTLFKKTEPEQDSDQFWIAYQSKWLARIVYSKASEHEIWRTGLEKAANRVDELRPQRTLAKTIEDRTIREIYIGSGPDHRRY